MERIAMRKAIAAATAKDNAREFAERYYEDIPEDLLATLCLAPDWFEQLTAKYPDAAPHREWFDLVRLAFVDFAREDGVLPPAVTTLPNAADARITATGKGETDTRADNGAAVTSSASAGSATPGN